jgi:hypothetical protein
MQTYNSVDVLLIKKVLLSALPTHNIHLYLIDLHKCMIGYLDMNPVSHF